MIARVALAAGFGLDFETCSPMVLAAVMEELAGNVKRNRRAQLVEMVRQRVGR